MKLHVNDHVRNDLFFMSNYSIINQHFCFYRMVNAHLLFPIRHVCQSLQTSEISR